MHLVPLVPAQLQRMLRAILRLVAGVAASSLGDKMKKEDVLAALTVGLAVAWAAVSAYPIT